MTSPRKVLHIITGLNVGGAESMLLKTIKETAECKSIVFSLTGRGSLTQAFMQAGADLYFFNLRKPVDLLKLFVSLLRVNKFDKPEMVLGWMYHACLISLFLFFIPGKPKVYWNIRHSLEDFSNERISLRLIIKLLAKLSWYPQRIIYNSTVSAAQHENIGFRKEKSLFIPNGISTSKFAPSVEKRAKFREYIEASEDQIIIGTVARNHPMKNLIGFVEAAHQLIHRFPEVKFLIVGRGTENLKELIDEHNMTESFYVLGERHDIDFVMNGLDIFTLCSKWGEGFPNVLGEAMATGVPCVATNIGDTGLILNERSYILDEFSVNELVEKWTTLITLSPASRMALQHKLRIRILENYTMEKIGKMYMEL